jgi:hypothetical protein
LTTLKEFEDALREQGMQMALAILQKLRERDRAKRTVAPARRIAGRKMTPDLARRILELHGTTEMTQQEIAFELGINQGRVNEVIKHRKWLNDDPNAPEAVARDKAKARMAEQGNRRASRTAPVKRESKPAQPPAGKKRRDREKGGQGQLILGDI